MRIFGSLESQIMPILWRDGQATVKQVHRELIAWRAIAYTTVMTTMERLEQRGVLTREQRGLAYLYTLALSREEYAALGGDARPRGRAPLKMSTACSGAMGPAWGWLPLPKRAAALIRAAPSLGARPRSCRTTRRLSSCARSTRPARLPGWQRDSAPGRCQQRRQRFAPRHRELRARLQRG
jgi:hypothetical protein